MDKDDLLKIIQDDDDGLLVLKPKASPTGSSSERLVASFLQINDFFRTEKREPSAAADIKEIQLFRRLAGIRNDEKKRESLLPYDEFGLLESHKVVNSIDNIFQDDDLGLLEDDAASIFELKHVPNPKEVTNVPDYVAKRKPCKDFAVFEPLFNVCQRDLSSGARKLLPFSQGSEIYKGDFFVLKGILVYVADIGKRQPTPDGNTFNARLHCVFENGTESDMLLRSLAAALYEDGRRVSGHRDKLLHTVNEISSEDQQTGFIYVLRSLSDRAEIKKLKNLYKIGFSTTSVEDRIKNASKEPTYLMAPVAIVTTFQCYNLNPHKLESLLHHFFGRACLDLDVFDNDGRRIIPKEWFVAPISIITQAIEMVISGEIVDFKYDEVSQSIQSR